MSDFGKGVASFERVVQLSPNIIKMDRYFAQNLQSATSVQKIEMLKSMVTYCNSSNIQIILEGIEQPKELDAAKNTGVTHTDKGFC
ncbi:EAL domain-containing protein [Alkalibacillus silvisoli]|uniref:EAL domain-containing protein n=1 Tax=Alkalibacillus silvisoli TaxID=392823 RepID=A0ABP3JN96_9BACI